MTPEGHALGALCVIDRQPRELSAEQRSALRTLSHVVVTQLRLRRDLLERQRAEEELRQVTARMELAVRGSKIGIWANDMPGGVYEDGRGHGINMWEQLGYDRPESPTRITDWFDRIHPQDRERVATRASKPTWPARRRVMKPSTGSGTTTGRTAGSCRAAWPSATPRGRRSASSAVPSISPTAGGPRRRCARARSDSGASSIRPSWASHGSIWTAGSSRRTRGTARSWGDPKRNCTNCESRTSLTRMIWPGTYPSSTNSQKEDRPSRLRNGTSGRMGHRFGSTIAYRRSWVRRAIRTPSSLSRWM